MDNNENRYAEFGEHYSPLNEARELVGELTCVDFTIWRPLPDSYYQVYELKVDVLVVYIPSLIHLDAISIPKIAENFD
jgi:hypothetical protein